MKNVLKSSEPEELQNYKKRYSTQFRRWNNLKQSRDTLTSIRSTLISDQKGLCAYCEMSIYQKPFSVEHFFPCEQSTREENHDLNWQNMLAICIPPGGVEDDSLPNAQLPHSSPCCGKAKDNFIPDGRLLNPLQLPTQRLFRFSSADGEILPDESGCERSGIPIEYAQFTIHKLGLNVDRLKSRRLAVIDEIIKELDSRDDGINDRTLLDKQVASEYFDNRKDNYPRFFTTIRWVLDEGAEKHLLEISYSG
ncbi:retron system putative HNH endonuclease [Tumidithrix elongata RA019]|uniref:Retron system putative HNH endonuclease n=1 Tax=Tumidithrix elongata BACA0141 TaxID=2716417 RepID=A0AAW9Q5N0_9CYAN|nr:retron system putative HNH endonuclease [Tumidithrix elongata RA019]